MHTQRSPRPPSASRAKPKAWPRLPQSICRISSMPKPRSWVPSPSISHNKARGPTVRPMGLGGTQPLVKQTVRLGACFPLAARASLDQISRAGMDTSPVRAGGESQRWRSESVKSQNGKKTYFLPYCSAADQFHRGRSGIHGYMVRTGLRWRCDAAFRAVERPAGVPPQGYGRTPADQPHVADQRGAA